MQALNIIYCPVEPHLPVFVKVKKMLAKRPNHACVKTNVSLVKSNMVCGRKRDDDENEIHAGRKITA